MGTPDAERMRIPESTAPANAIAAPSSSACWKPSTNWSAERGSVRGTVSAAATIEARDESEFGLLLAGL
jgi:hypothetical protein